MTAEAPSTTREADLAARLAPSAPGPPRYAVKAVWRTLQGEGFWAGRPAVFVRLAGCNMWDGEPDHRERDYERTGAACALFCDTDFRKRGSVRLDARDLAAEVRRVAADGPGAPVRFAVLTGGEPLLQADAALVRALHADGFTVAVETNGTQTLAGAFGPDPRDHPDWVVCSPKLPEAALPIEACDELKLVVPGYRPEAYPGLADRVRPHAVAGRLWWVQPEDGPRLADAARLAVDLALADPRWRVSVQGHKALGVD
ncbi:MAG TPA: 7-carboxy-7-deazaguanine synthase QueE [Rubricoccaceae bacterium]